MELEVHVVGDIFDTPKGRVRVVEDPITTHSGWRAHPNCYGCAFYHSRFCELYECLSWNRPDSKSVHFELINDKNRTNGTKNL